MLDKKERAIMLFLSKVCESKKTYLISASQIAEGVANKYLFSTDELDEILISLSKDNYIDFVAMDGKKGYYYCVNMKNKGLSFVKDQQKAKRELVMALIKTFGLALLSFIIGFLLRMIFKG